MAGGGVNCEETFFTARQCLREVNRHVRGGSIGALAQAFRPLPAQLSRRFGAGRA